MNESLLVAVIMFSTRVPLISLAEFCRNLRHMCEAGLTLAQAMKQQGKKGPLPVRSVAARIAEKLADGDDLPEALKEERDYFPPLFCELVAVAEESGRLPDVLQELEEYFELQVKLWRQFVSTITWPVIQFVAAILVLTLLIWILGMIEGVAGKNSFSVFGLKGGTHAVLFLVGNVGFFAGLYGLYWLLRNVFRSGPAVDSFLLMIPGLGGMLEALAIARFSMGLSMTMESGMSTSRALRLSLRATGNHAFMAQSPKAERLIKEGQDLAYALRETALFPSAFVEVLETAEISGQIPESMSHQARVWNDTAARRMKGLTWIATGLTYMLIAGVLIFFIMSIAMQIMQPYQDAMKLLGD